MAMTNQASVSRFSLVVEDDPELQQAMVKQLQAAQFLVLPAADYAGAVRHLARSFPSVAFVDIGLPNESGYALCEYIRARPELMGMPIIVTGERAFPQDMANAEEVGANAFLKKPFKMTRMLDCMAMLFDGQRTTRPGTRRLRAF
jgi:DNA-binding response OmpR family regulator